MSNELKRWISAFSSARHSVARSTSLCRLSTTLFTSAACCSGVRCVSILMKRPERSIRNKGVSKTSSGCAPLRNGLSSAISPLSENSRGGCGWHIVGEGSSISTGKNVKRRQKVSTVGEPFRGSFPGPGRSPVLVGWLACPKLPSEKKLLRRHGSFLIIWGQMRTGVYAESAVESGACFGACSYRNSVHFTAPHCNLDRWRMCCI